MKLRIGRNLEYQEARVKQLLKLSNQNPAGF